MFPKANTLVIGHGWCGGQPIRGVRKESRRQQQAAVIIKSIRQMAEQT